MPNHVQTKVIVAGDFEEGKRFIKEILNPDENGEIEFDFNKIIPMPEIFNDIHKGLTTIDGEKVERWRVIDGKLTKISKKEQEEIIKKYKTDNSIDWCNSNWGTKWSAMDVCCHTNPINNITEEDEIIVEFSFWTAWGFALPIFETLTDMYPKIEFHITCFDEGWGFAGKGIISDYIYTFDICEPTDELYEEVFG